MGAGGGAIAAQGLTDIGKVEAAKVMQRRAQNFSMKMMKNRHQWEVDDLRAAGLNPILGYVSSKIGGGGGGMAASVAPGIPGGGSIGSTALSASKLKLEREVLKQQAESLASTALQARSMATLNAMRARKVELEVDEFPVRARGMIRRGVKEAGRITDFIESVADKVSVPQWARDILQNMNAAPR